MLTPGIFIQSHFLLAVYKTDDTKTYGMNAVLERIITDIGEMDMIEVYTAEFKGTAKAGVAQVCGDDLGLNGILGYTESFSGLRVCRWCHVKKGVLRAQTVSLHNYNADLLLNNLTETGIKRECFLNRLQFYPVTDNAAPDIMHDILEGIEGFEHGAF